MERNTYATSAYIETSKEAADAYLRDLRNLDEWTLYSNMVEQIDDNTWRGTASGYHHDLYYHARPIETPSFGGVEWLCGREPGEWYQCYPAITLPASYLGSDEPGVYFHWLSFVGPERATPMIMQGIDLVHASEIRSLKAVLERQAGLRAAAQARWEIRTNSIFVDAPLDMAVDYLGDAGPNFAEWAYFIRPNGGAGSFFDEYDQPVDVTISRHDLSNYVVLEFEHRYRELNVVQRNLMFLVPTWHAFGVPGAKGIIQHRVAFFEVGAPRGPRQAAHPGLRGREHEPQAQAREQGRQPRELRPRHELRAPGRGARPVSARAAEVEAAPDLRAVLRGLATGAPLAEREATAVFDEVMEGRATGAQIGGLLMAMRVRGETLAEIVGAARSLRARMDRAEAPAGAVDVCGTGGDGAGTINISTTVAFVVAACGVPVAKHCNRAVTSRSGAADVLEALGVPLDVPAHALARAMRETGVGFLFAPRHHEAMRHVAPSRRELGARTLFNLVGPLANPAGASRQLLGVFDPRWVPVMAEALRALGSERAWVVHGEDGLDEVTTTGRTLVSELRGRAIRSFEVTPEEAGLPRARPEDLLGGGAEANAVALRMVLQGRTGPHRDVVLLNAAAALVVAGRAEGLAEGVSVAARAVDSGAAAAKLDALLRSLEPVA